MNHIVIEREREMKKGKEKEKEVATVVLSADRKYVQWKSLIPVLYDWITNHNLPWPSQSCRWGPQIQSSLYKNTHRLYFSEQTDGSFPNTLVIANCEVVKPRVAAAEHIAQFKEESRSPFIKKSKTIIHPGEVNRIRELWQNTNIVATHTDSPEVLIWDLVTQPNRQALSGATPSRPDLVLTGHTDNAEFALAMCRTEPFVLSGGKDKSVVLWNIHDHISTLASAEAEAESKAKKGSKAAKDKKKATESPSVGPRGIYQGHTDNVEDVQFCPSSAQEFCSVGDDSCLLFWDARVGYAPVLKAEQVHKGDIHSVDWNAVNTNYLLTGSADTAIHMFDRRRLDVRQGGSPVNVFQAHGAPVLCVQWCPDRQYAFASSAEDGILNIWDVDKLRQPSSGPDGSQNPTALLFQHAGHRDKVVDFQWNHHDPWTIVSVSDDCGSTVGGGTLQIWRMLDLLYRPEDEVLEELKELLSQINKPADKD